MHRIWRAALALMIAAGLTAPAAAQSSVTQSDIQRLQDNIYEVSTDLSRLRDRDAERARQLQTELDETREEAIYLKVKLRKNQPIARSEYADVRDRVEDIRTRARGDATGAYSAAGAQTNVQTGSGTGTRAATGTGTRSTTSQSSATGARAAANEVPAGTEIDVRLLNSLSSGTAQVEDRFEGTTLVDLSVDGRVLLPAGSLMRGVVTAVEPATRTNRTARLTVSFDQVTVGGRAYPIRATVTQAIEGEGIKGEAGRIGAGAGVGAIIGGILGGFKGALAGILIGGGGTIAATEGKEVELPQGTVLRVRFDSPASIGR